MSEEIIIDECFNCKKKKNIGDNWRTCKLKCSYKYKRKENDYITRLEQENKKLKESTNEAKIEYENLLINRNDFAERAEKLEQENKRLQMLSCANCGEKYLSPDGAELYEKNVHLQKENEELKTNIELIQTALCAIRFSCKLKLEEGQKALYIEPIMRIIDEVLKNE